MARPKNPVRRTIDHLRNAVRRRVLSAGGKARIVDEFHRLYYDPTPDAVPWQQTYWMGRTTLKCPLDLWQYQEIIHELRPDLIVETGTFDGGSALFLAHMLDAIGGHAGGVMTVDIDPHPGRPVHERITYLTGSSIDRTVLKPVFEAARDARTVMVILDSDHSRDHVLAEMRLLAPLVTVGSFLIVEDTNINGHPVFADFGDGPMEAVDAFLAENDGFDIDSRAQKFLLSFNPRGYLRRRK